MITLFSSTHTPTRKMTAVNPPFELGTVYRMRLSLTREDCCVSQRTFDRIHTHDPVVFRVVGLIYTSSESVVPTESKRDTFVKKEPTLQRIVTSPAVLGNKMRFTVLTRDSISVDLGWSEEEYLWMPCTIEKATPDETKKCIDDIWEKWVHAEYVKRVKAEEAAKKKEKEAKKEELTKEKVYEKCKWCGATTHPNAECLADSDD